MEIDISPEGRAIKARRAINAKFADPTNVLVDNRGIGRYLRHSFAVCGSNRVPS